MSRTHFAPQSESPSSAYEDWRKDWSWDKKVPLPRAMPGKLIVEFSPPASSGTMWTPEDESSNAIVVSDGDEHRRTADGYIPLGQEIAYIGMDGVYFEYYGRRLCVIKKADVHMLVTG